MADNWEEEDWEKEDFTPALKPAAAVNLPKSNIPGYDPSKFAGEDEEPEEEKKHAVPAPQPKKEKKVIGADKEKMGVVEDVPLDDPLAEKLRQQRLVEAADLQAAKDLFGGGGGSNPLDAFLPKSKEDYEKFGEMVAREYLEPHKHKAGAHFKAMMKAMLKTALASSSAGEIKELSQHLSVLSADRLKEESNAKAAQAAAAKKTVGKKTLNVGKSGGSAGLDDFMYDEVPGDDYDFM